MRQLILLVAFIISAILSFSQKTDWNIKLGSGAFFFSGKSAVESQSVYQVGSVPNSVSSSFGKTPGFSQTAGISLQRIAKSRLLFGIELEFQSLAARSEISQVGKVASLTSSFLKIEPAKGHATFRSINIALSPVLGARFKAGTNSQLDLNAGPEIAFMLDSWVKAKYKGQSDNDYLKAKREATDLKTDIRFGFSLSWHISRMIIYAGYVKGFPNYYKGYLGANPEAYSNFFRFGIGCRLK